MKKKMRHGKNNRKQESFSTMVIKQRDIKFSSNFNSPERKVSRHQPPKADSVTIHFVGEKKFDNPQAMMEKRWKKWMRENIPKFDFDDAVN